MVGSKLNLSIKFFQKRALITIIILLVLFLSGIAIFIYSGVGGRVGVDFTNIFYKKDASSINVEKLVIAVGKKVLLPSEIPTIATVSDKTKLMNQPFFEKAENGDKALIYKGEQIAILYRPSIDKIINIGPVSIEDEGLQSVPNENEELSSVDVVILNGTSTVGLTAVAAEFLAELDFVVVNDRDDAVDKPYANSIVVVLNNSVNSQAEIIASSLSAEIINELPDEEDALEADIIIILGEDYALSVSE